MYSSEIQNILKSKKIETGCRIKIFKKKECYEGILMPRPDFGDPSILVIKLDNGYNIGIKFEKGMEITKIGPPVKLEKFPVKKIERKIGLPKISLISTGGTIASRIDYLTGGVRMALTPQEILFAVPEINEIVDLKSVKPVFNLASEDMWYKHWQTLAQEVAKELNGDVKGVIITHGTDTMHFSSAALSFMLKNLTKPVVFTGAQRSSDRGSSDSVMNLICSSYIAGYSNIAEVGICMHAETNDSFNYFIRGTKVRKMHSTMRNAFRPINEIPLAKVFPDGKIEVLNENHKKSSKGKVIADTKFEPKVCITKAYPGSDPEIIDFYVKKGFRGIVVEGTGMGHVPTSTEEKERSWINHLKSAVESGVTVVVTSQTIYGRVHPFVYRNLRILGDTGVIFGEDMLTETAYVKLGWVLGHEKKPEKVKELMLKNIAGEISLRTDPRSFLF